MQVTPDDLCVCLNRLQLAHGYHIATPHPMTAKSPLMEKEKQLWNLAVPTLWKSGMPVEDLEAGASDGLLSFDPAAISDLPPIPRHHHNSSIPPHPPRLLQPDPTQTSTTSGLWIIPRGDHPQLPLPEQYFIPEASIRPIRIPPEHHCSRLEFTQSFPSVAMASRGVLPQILTVCFQLWPQVIPMRSHCHTHGPSRDSPC